MEKNQSNKAFSEVIASSLTGWLGQSWRWDSFPPFGSLTTITTNKRTWFGLVYEVKTGSSDPSRSPFTYKKTEEELLAEQPQIFEFLQTTFSCLTLGYLQQERIFYQIAPEPPKIHAFIEPCSAMLTKQFLASTGYMPLLFASPQVQQVDELIIALIQEQKRLGLLSDDKLFELMDIITLLTGNDYRRIKILSRRLQA